MKNLLMILKKHQQKLPTPKQRLKDGDDKKTQIHEGKFAGRKGDFIKYKDEYFDIKKTAGSTIR